MEKGGEVRPVGCVELGIGGRTFHILGRQYLRCVRVLASERVCVSVLMHTIIPIIQHMYRRYNFKSGFYTHAHTTLASAETRPRGGGGAGREGVV